VVEPYADRDPLANDARRRERSATGDVAVAVGQFLAEVDILARGEDPDWPLSGRRK
jgi:hypothetical protein